MPKPKPSTTMPHLLNNFLIRTNYHLQTTPNNKAKTELQTFKLHKSLMRKRFRLEARDIYQKDLSNFQITFWRNNVLLRNRPTQTIFILHYRQ